MSKPWYDTIGYPVKVLNEGTWKNGTICSAYRYENGEVSVKTADGIVIWFGDSPMEEFLKPNFLNDDPWIKVTKMLPEENQKVWVTKEYHGGDRRVDESIFRFGEFESSGYRGITCTDLVRAWMPRFVPEPYKEES